MHLIPRAFVDIQVSGVVVSGRKLTDATQNL